MIPEGVTMRNSNLNRESSPARSADLDDDAAAGYACISGAMQLSAEPARNHASCSSL